MNDPVPMNRRAKIRRVADPMTTRALSHFALPRRTIGSSTANGLEVTSLLVSAQGSECSVGGVVGCREDEQRLRGSEDGSDEQALMPWVG